MWEGREIPDVVRGKDACLGGREGVEQVTPPFPFSLHSFSLLCLHMNCSYSFTFLSASLWSLTGDSTPRVDSPPLGGKRGGQSASPRRGWLLVEIPEQLGRRGLREGFRGSLGTSSSPCVEFNTDDPLDVCRAEGDFVEMRGKWGGSCPEPWCRRGLRPSLLALPSTLVGATA